MQNILYNKAFDIDNIFLNFRSFFAELVNAADINSKIIVVPTAKYARHLRQIYTRKHFDIHNKPCSTINILNFDAFVNYLYEAIDTESDKTIISDSYRFLLIESAIKQSNSDYFKQKSGRVKLSLSKKIDSLIMGLKKKGITPEKMLKDVVAPETSSSEITNRKKYQEIQEIFSKYHELLGENLLDQVDILKYIIKSIEGISAESIDIFDTIDIPIKHDNPIDSVLQGINEIIFYGFSDFAIPEQRLISLFTHSNSIQVAIYLENIASDSKYNLPDVSVRFISYGFIQYMQPHLFEEDKLNKILKSSLFIKNTKAQDSKIENLPVYLNCSESSESEISDISKFVSYLIREEKILPNEIAVVAREAGTYAKSFRDEFLRYQIPLNISDRFELQNSSIVSTVLNILDTVIFGYKLNNLEKVFASYYLQHLDIDFPIIRKYAYKLRIVGGHNRGGLPAWKRRLESYKNYLIAKLKDNSFFENDLEQLTYEKEKYELEIASNELSKIELLFPTISKNLTTSEFIELILKILKNVKFEERIASDNSRLQASQYDSKYIKESIQDSIEKDGRALDSFQTLLNELSYLYLNNLETYDAKIHIDKLKVLVSGTKYQIREKEQFGVTLTSIEQTRGLPYKFVILCGAMEGNFPLPFKTNNLLGKELPESNLHHIQQERNLLYVLLTGNLSDSISKGRKIVISYSKKDDKNEFARSHFIEELLSTLSIEDEESLMLKSNFNFEQHNPKFKHLNANPVVNRREVDLELSNETTHIKKFDKPFSPTSFERYTECPFRYMLKTIYDIEELETDELMLSPLEKGSLLHKILYTFYSELAKDENHWVAVAILNNGNTLNGIKLESAKTDYYLELLVRIAEVEIKKYTFEHPLFKVETDRVFGNDSFKGILSLWLTNEVEFAKNNSKIYPVYFEYSFGNPNEPEIRLNQDVKIKGKIDRIELSPDLKYFAIADYKSNADGQKKDKPGEFTKFQMPLYSYAVSIVLSNLIDEEFHHLYGIYYSLNPVKKWNKIALYSKEDYFEYYSNKPKGKFNESLTHSELIDRIEEYKNAAIDIANKIRNGKFNIEPILKISYCSKCSFKQICRIKKFEFKI